jgi:hypothetical protein
LIRTSMPLAHVHESLTPAELLDPGTPLEILNSVTPKGAASSKQGGQATAVVKRKPAGAAPAAIKTGPKGIVKRRPAAKRSK